jgi:hypothetical protein
MKDLIFITAYCPTEEQERVLEKCVDSVLKCGKHIALISHSHISTHIQKKCQYYVYDYNNDVSDDYNLMGHYTFNFPDNKKIHSRFFVKNFYGFAIYRMFSIACQLAINFGYENLHHIEYDCELLDTNLIHENIESLKEYDSVICTDTGDESGWLFGAFKSFKVSSLPDKFKNYDRDFIESEMKNVTPTHLEYLTKKLFIDSGKPLFKNEPTSDKFIKNTINEHRGLHHTLYYNPEDKTLNIYYRSVKNTSEEIVVIVDKTKIINIQTEPYHWHIRPLGIFDEINHVRVDNSQKVIYDINFNSEFREVFKIKSYINNEQNN